MQLDLTDEERQALIRLLRTTVDGGLYFLSPPVEKLRAILDKLVPPAPKPAPPEPRGRMVPPRAGRGRRR